MIIMNKICAHLVLSSLVWYSAGTSSWSFVLGGGTALWGGGGVGVGVGGGGWGGVGGGGGGGGVGGGVGGGGGGGGGTALCAGGQRSAPIRN